MMNEGLWFAIVILSLGIPLAICWGAFFKIAEQKHWTGKIWWVCLIILVICIGITLTLALTIPRQIMVIISAVCWGIGGGTIAGLITYKLVYRQKKGGLK